MTPRAATNAKVNKGGAVMCLMLLLSGADQAHAQSQALLTWDAPSSCPQRDEVLAAVREIAGDKVLAMTSLHAVGKISPLDSKFRLELQIEGESGTYTRTLDARKCGDLLKAAAVVLGLNLKRMASEQTDGSAPEGLAEGSSDPTLASPPSAKPETQSAPITTVAPSKTVPAQASPRPEPSEPSEPPSWWLGLPHLQVAVGELPNPTVWWTGTLGKRWDPWMTWVSGKYASQQQAEYAAAGNVGVLVSRYGVEFGVAHGWRGQTFEWAPGVLLGVERLAIRGGGEDLVAASASANVVLLGANVAGRWSLTDWLSMAVTIGADIPMSRPRFVVQSLGELGRLGPVIARLGAGVDWNL